MQQLLSLLFFVKAVQSSYFQKIVLTLDQIEVIRKLYQAFSFNFCGGKFLVKLKLINIKCLSLINTMLDSREL